MAWKAAVLATALAATPLTSTPTLAQQASVAELPPEKVALSEEIVRIAFPEATREAVFNRALDSTIEQINQSSSSLPSDTPPELRAYLMEERNKLIAEIKAVIARHIPSMMTGLSNAYADTFTVDELTKIRDFAATPAGQSFLQKSTDLMSNPYYTAAFQPYMTEVFSKIEEWQAASVDGVRKLMEGVEE